MRPELETILRLAGELSARDLPGFLGELETVRVTALARITSPKVKLEEDRLLDVTQAGARLGVSEGFLYKNHSRFGSTRRVGRTLRFSSKGIDAYIHKYILTHTESRSKLSA